MVYLRVSQDNQKNVYELQQIVHFSVYENPFFYCLWSICMIVDLRGYVLIMKIMFMNYDR